MFWGASSFDQNIGAGRTTTSMTMGGMFNDASSFNQDISAWSVENVSEMMPDVRPRLVVQPEHRRLGVDNVTNMHRMFFKPRPLTRHRRLGDPERHGHAAPCLRPGPRLVRRQPSTRTSAGASMSCGVAQKDETGDCQIKSYYYYDDDDDDDDGATELVMSTGLAAIGITFTGITIAAIANAFQEQCALGPTIVYEAGTTHPYYISPNLCTIGTKTFSSKKTVRAPAAQVPARVLRGCIGEGQTGAQARPGPDVLLQTEVEPRAAATHHAPPSLPNRLPTPGRCKAQYSFAAWL